ncbi:MAG: AmmeMemoRadiSam system radical SAM enzyme [Planctomycetota bacterium]
MERGGGNRDLQLWERVVEGSLRCNVCARRCVIAEGRTGFCGARKNVQGGMKLLVYGRVASIHPAEMERKPLYHFHPGQKLLSVGTVGCNFRCPGCQNWELAHADVEREVDRLPVIAPEELVARAKALACAGLSFTYNEPTVWLEYTFDCMMLAKRAGMLTSYVTNGAMTTDALDAIGPWLDAFRVDIKAFSRRAYKAAANFEAYEAVLENASRAKRRWKMHVEVVTNVVPGRNDDEGELLALAQWIVRELGADVPWHITRFHPSFRLSGVGATPIDKLERIRESARRAGLRFAYLGNVPGHKGENTHCPACGELLIERDSFRIVRNRLDRGRCFACGEAIPGCW